MTVTVAPWGFLSLHFLWLSIQFTALIFLDSSAPPRQPDTGIIKGLYQGLMQFDNFSTFRILAVGMPDSMCEWHLVARWSFSHGFYNFQLDFCSPWGTIYLLLSGSSCSFVRSPKRRLLMYSCGMSESFSMGINEPLNGLYWLFLY